MKTIVITGVSSGLGKAFFSRLSQSDSQLIGISRTFSNEQIELAKARPDRICLLETDLATSWQVLDTKPLELALARFACDELVFISNAGTIQPISPVGMASAEAIRDSMAVNMLGPMMFARVLTDHARRLNGRLTILNISSGAATRAIAGWSSYCSAKAGIHMFFDVLAAESAGASQVRITHIDPGVLDTGMQKAIRSAERSDMPARDDFIRLEKEGKLRDPDDVASEIVSKYLGQ